MATPLEISIALHYHCMAGDYGKGVGANNFDAPAVQDALRRMVECGLLARCPVACESKYYATDGLHTWVRALCSVQWPVIQWVIPDTLTPKD